MSFLLAVFQWSFHKQQIYSGWNPKSIYVWISQLHFPLVICVVGVYVQGYRDKDRNGKIGMRDSYNVENENTCEPLIISLFKNLSAK